MATTMRNSPMLEAFLTQFAAGAGTEYQWSLNDCGEIRATTFREETNRYSDMRGHYVSVEMCPLSAGLTLRDGEVYSAGEIYTAVEFFNLADDDVEMITSAADGDVCFDDEDRDIVDLAKTDRAMALRARLLCICGLKEELDA